MKLDDPVIIQNRKELECHPVGDAGRADALYNLALSLGDRFIIEKSEIRVHCAASISAGPPTC